MRIVDNYNYLPGCCWICRGVSKPIIDLEIDLDGVNSPDDPNPSAITRLYICADCAIELGRQMAPHRSLEIVRAGELAQANRVANELAARAETAETQLENIAAAIAGVASRRGETAGSTHVPDEGGSEQPLTESADAPPLRRRGRPRREQPTAPVEEINTDFVGDL
jgi:hypothetical protein